MTNMKLTIYLLVAFQLLSVIVNGCGRPCADESSGTCCIRSGCGCVEMLGSDAGCDLDIGAGSCGEILPSTTDMGSTEMEPTYQMCGGFAGFECDEGYICIDDPSDDCDPYDYEKPGSDCAGICVEETCCETPDPLLFWEGAACCPDGTVSGSIGDGKTFFCPGLGSVVKGENDDLFGVFCDAGSSTIEPTEFEETGKSGCCDRDEYDLKVAAFHCREGCACCPDGTIVGSIGDAQTYTCPSGFGTLVKGRDEFGEFCDELTEEPLSTESTEVEDEVCCDRDEYDFMVNNLRCPEGCMCCPDGSIVGSIGDARTFTCENGVTLVKGEDEFGEFCDEEPESTEVDDEVCCDRDEYDEMVSNLRCPEGCMCCPDGSIVGSIGDARTFTCKNGVTLIKGEDEFGEFCDEDGSTMEPVTTGDIFPSGPGSDANTYGVMMVFGVVIGVFGWI